MENHFYCTKKSVVIIYLLLSFNTVWYWGFPLISAADNNCDLKGESADNSVHVSLLETEKDSFIKKLISQVDVKLENTSIGSDTSANITSQVFYRLYHRFMEDLLRRSCATKICRDDSELLASDIQVAINSSTAFEFLDSVFISKQSE